MRTEVFCQGYNRIEDRRIMQVERARLNQLLTKERRVIEILIRSAGQKVRSKLALQVDVKVIWRNIITHNTVQNIRRRLDHLTKDYPQFREQVLNFRNRIKEKFIEELEAVRQAVHLSLSQRLSR